MATPRRSRSAAERKGWLTRRRNGNAPPRPRAKTTSRARPKAKATKRTGWGATAATRAYAKGAKDGYKKGYQACQYGF